MKVNGWLIPFNSTCGVDTSFLFPHYSILDHISLDNKDWLSGFQFCIVILILSQNDLLIALMFFLIPHFVGGAFVNFFFKPLLELYWHTLDVHFQIYQFVITMLALLLDHSGLLGLYFSFSFFFLFYFAISISLLGGVGYEHSYQRQ